MWTRSGCPSSLNSGNICPLNWIASPNWLSWIFGVIICGFDFAFNDAERLFRFAGVDTEPLDDPTADTELRRVVLVLGIVSFPFPVVVQTRLSANWGMCWHNYQLQVKEASQGAKNIMVPTSVHQIRGFGRVLLFCSGPFFFSFSFCGIN